LDHIILTFVEMDLSFGPQQINVCLNGSQIWTTAN